MSTSAHLRWTVEADGENVAAQPPRLTSEALALGLAAAASKNSGDNTLFTVMGWPDYNADESSRGERIAEFRGGDRLEEALALSRG